MSVFCRFLRNVILLMLMALALPVMAASTTKFFYAKFPVTIPLGTSNQTFTIFNATPPPGVSTINSMEIDAPVGVTINSISPGTLLNQNAVDSQNRHIYLVNNLPGIKSGKSAVFTINVTVSVPTCASGTWGIAANTGNAYPQGDNFVDQHPADENLSTGLGCDGQVSCASVQIPFDFQAQDGTSGQGVRGWNKDGSPCNKVDYHFSVDTTHFIANLQWDTAVQPNAAFSWNVVWAPEDVDPATGWLSRRPKLSWTTDGSGQPINIINGVACLSAIPPTPYGILVNGLLSSTAGATDTVTLDTTTTINTQGPAKTSVPPSAPFPIVIGTERMQVTAVSGGPTYTLSVTRGAGGTVAAAHAASTGATQTIVMSTPLPIDPNATLADGTSANPYYTLQDHMCVWDQGWTAAGINPITGFQQVRSSASVFDVGDGWVIGR